MADHPLPPLDRQRLQDALALAEGSIGLTDPNPRVGCVIGGADGTLLGCGATQEAGAAHAEVMALRDAQAAGRSVRGATAWVTLEPCAHHGRTPPCCDALIAAGIARAVVALGDPFPQVAGAGIARLRAAGIDVQVLPADDPIAVQAHALNIGFFSRVQRGVPWVRMKIAATLDGRTALPDGRSQWITGEAARADGHAWRRRASAVLTGIGTVRDDDPRLDVRAVPTARQPLRVVVDSRLETPPAARMLAPPEGEQKGAQAGSVQKAGMQGGGVLIVGALDDAPRRAALQAAGAEVLVQPGGNAKVDLPALLRMLAARGVNELHVEAGHKLNGSLLHAGLVDELLVYLAPKLMGAGREMAAFGPLAQLRDALAWRFVDSTLLGADLRLRLQRV